VELGQLAPQPDHRAERAQRLHAAVAAGKATTRRDDVTGLEPQQLERLALELTEALLAFTAKDLGDRAALGGDDHVIGLDEATTQTPREQPPAHGLAGSHESDQHDGAATHRQAS